MKLPLITFFRHNGKSILVLKIRYYLYEHADSKAYKFTIDGNLFNENKETKKEE